MSNVIPVIGSVDFTTEQLALIKTTVAKGATNDELQLFLYRCKRLGLDPLKPGHIHFIKYGNSPGTIVIGLDGFRYKASKTGKHTGTHRGVVRDESGVCIGAWCEVYRSDWTQPAREEVSLSEYNTGKGQWLKMPETMIKKVAEVAALRMAFPDELGGLYSVEEMEQAEKPARFREVVNHATGEIIERPQIKSIELPTEDDEVIQTSDLPLHCGKPMIKDRFGKPHYFCMTCKTKVPFSEVES